MFAGDLLTFALAFLTPLLFIHIPEEARPRRREETLLASARAGLVWLRRDTAKVQMERLKISPGAAKPEDSYMCSIHEKNLSNV